MMKRTCVELGGGTGHTVGPGSGRRYSAQRPGTCSLSPAAGQGRRWSGMRVQLAFWRRCLVHEAALTPLPGTATPWEPPSSPPKQGVISVRHSLFAAQVPSFALHGDFGGASLPELPFTVQEEQLCLTFNCFVIEIHLLVSMATAASPPCPSRNEVEIAPPGWVFVCICFPWLEQITKNWGSFLRQERDLVWNAGRMEMGRSLVPVPECSQ